MEHSYRATCPSTDRVVRRTLSVSPAQGRDPFVGGPRAQHTRSVDSRDLALDDVARRASDAARRGDPDASVTDVRQLEGGVSSLTYSAVLEAGGESRPVVLKFAPPGLPPVRNRDVLRQAFVLERLRGLDGFPVPAVVAQDPGDPPEVPPMFAMELLPGDAYEPMLDVSPEPPTDEDVRDRVHAAARALARLQSRDPLELGVREPAIPVAAELDRWRDLFATVDADIAPGHAELYARLADRLPHDAPPVLVHGDYRAANMLFVGPRLTAVIDWEIWGVGDPRVDLSWLLLHTEPPHTFYSRRPPADLAAGRLMPSARSVVSTYAEERRRLGASPDQLEPVLAEHEWFTAWATYKVASTIAVIHKRDRKRALPDPKIEVAAARLHEVLDAGHVALDSRPRAGST